MSGPTPGPWTVKRSSGAMGNVGFDVNGPRGVVGALTEADARLIAAAPDLLEALQSIWNLDPNEYSIPVGQFLATLQSRIVGPIAKAEGSEIEGLPEGETIASYVNSYGDGEADQSALTGGHFEVRE